MLSFWASGGALRQELEAHVIFLKNFAAEATDSVFIKEVLVLDKAFRYHMQQVY